MPPTWHGYTWINGVVPGHSYSTRAWLCLAIMRPKLSGWGLGVWVCVCGCITLQPGWLGVIHPHTFLPPKKGGKSIKYSGSVLLSRTIPRAVPSALEGLTTGFGMGPGVSLPLWPPENLKTIQ